MANRRGTIDESIIHQVTGLSKKKLMSIRKEIQEVEPEFEQWIRQSTKEDVTNIKYGGVEIRSEDAAKNMGSVLLRAKIEGYLMAMTASDRIWADRFFLECTEEDEIPYEIPIQAFMAGKLDHSEYVELEKRMTDDEKKDKSNWKNVAIEAYKKNNSTESSEQDIKKYLSRTKRKKAPPKGDDDNLTTLTP